MSSSSQRRYLDQAAAHAKAGRSQRAESIYRQILRQEPGNTEALFQIAILAIDAADWPTAIAYFRKLLSERPELAEVHFNLGTILARVGQIDEAMNSFQQAIAMQPEFSDAYNNLGQILLARGDLEAALQHFTKASALAPQSLPANMNVTNTLLKLRRYDEAVTAAQRLVESHPTAGEAHFTLGLALDFAEQREAAVASFRKAVELRPDEAEWKFHLAARGEEQVPTIAPAEYVRTLFDAYAERFDEHLVGNLHYRTPEHLLAAITAVAPERTFEMLDLGCGTGLCGNLLHTRATRLVGIDLAPQMIKVAERRGIYTELQVADIAGYLRGRQAEFDLIVSADVFVYIGDLAEVFALTATALRPGGLFAFSVEAHDHEGYVLNEARRYAHSLPYLRALAAEHGLRELSVDPVVLRVDYGATVVGTVIVLEKK